MNQLDEIAIANGHPPEAEHVLCIDFDGVLYPFVGLMDRPNPIPGAVQAMKLLKLAGYRLVIFTSRLSSQWLHSSGHTWNEQHQYIAGLLERDGIPYEYITAEKIPAEAYIDDKAIRFNDNWNAIEDWLVFQEG